MNVDKYILKDLYTDYLIASTSQTTATGLSKLVESQISHDSITRLLKEGELFNSEAVWKASKPIVRETETWDGCIIVDDSIEPKPYTDESELICWHWDHTQNRSIKGVNFITAFYSHRGANIPLGVEFVRKSQQIKDPKTGKEKRVSDKSKNELYRELLRGVQNNQVKYRYVLNDTWFASAENMNFVKEELKKDFVMALKSNRKVALSRENKQQGKYVRIDALELEQGAPLEIYLEQIEFPVLLTKHIFKNEDGSKGILYLVSSDINLTFEQIAAIYKKRWKVEEFHKSVKCNASFAKSPTKTIQTQLSHFYASILSYIKLEWIKFRNGSNHFALKTKIYMQGLNSALMEVQKLSTIKFQKRMSY